MLNLFLLISILFQNFNLEVLPKKDLNELAFEVKNLSFFSIQFELNYNPEEMVFINVEKGEIAKDAIFAENHKFEGKVKVALASPKEIKGDGKLFIFSFKGKGKVFIKNILIDDKPFKDFEVDLRK